MKIVGYSDIGRVRKENQDAFWFNDPSQNSCIAVVCDGMGGINGGRAASSIAVQSVRDFVQNHSMTGNTEKKFRNLIGQCNRAVLNGAKENPEYIGMGTTMVLTLIQDQSISMANIGDSRGYHITNGSIHQVTKDHSAVQQLVDNGQLTERQAKIHPNRNIITRALGIEEEAEFDFFEFTAAEGDVILLCSDGLTNFVDENEIQFEAAGGAFEDLPRRLIDLANSRGGADNITVVAIQI
ncbi:MAG: Stp1/IreP family PP2C-type Ser/Thr phosphatase [Clostridia bacterium]|nr:Stp1/IreP family PP2C-type Ser/Thr phosphatase [Clostridia bacterium]